MTAIINTIKSTIAENFGGPSHSLAAPEHQFDIKKDIPDLAGKVALVTGGSEGIGFGCTHTLLANGISKLFILSLSQEIIDGALETISKELGSSTASKVTFMKCDLSDWKDVAETAKSIASQTDRIDILINCAARGIMTFQLTTYGVDRHMAVNHMGHVILTSHLLPVLKKTAEQGNTVRIVNFGSNAHQSTPSDCKFASLEELSQDLGPNAQYGRSKLAQMLYAKYLSKNLTAVHPKILVNCIHPGFVETKASTHDIHEAYPIAGYAMSVVANPFKKDQFMGATSALYCATKTESSGQYVCPPAIPEKGSKLYQDDELMESLMKLTKEIVGEKTKSDSVEKGCPLSLF